MENKKAKSIVRRYKIEKLIILFSVFIIFCAVLILTDLNIGIEILVFLIYFFLLNKINYWLSLYNFYSLIYNDLDSELFNDVINCLGKNKKISELWYVQSFYFTGDYRDMVSMCSESVKFDKRKLYQSNYLFMLAEVYFELGEKEKLKYTCEKIDLLLSDKNTFKQKFFGILRFIFLGINENKTLKIIFKNIKFFESYLESDLQESITMLDKRKRKTNYQKVNKDFYRAIIYYRSGDMTQSKMLFEEIIQKAPKMNFAKISQKYLEAIENSAGIDVSFSDMLQPQSNELS